MLHSFTGGFDGRTPSGVFRDAAGTLYGTALGGAGDAGVVYKLDANGQGNVLYTFAGPDGANPNPALIEGTDGDLYGTTSSGGSAGIGVVYKLDSMGQQTVLHSFSGEPDGDYPYSGVVRDLENNLYGTALGGGAFNAGIVYKLDSAGQEAVLYSFTGGADGIGTFGG